MTTKQTWIQQYLHLIDLVQSHVGGLCNREEENDWHIITTVRELAERHFNIQYLYAFKPFDSINPSTLPLHTEQANN